MEVDIGKDLLLYGIQPPASSAILAFILNIVKNYDLKPGDLNPLLFHRMTEAFKWAYAQRTKLADPQDSDVTDIVNDVIKQKLK